MLLFIVLYVLYCFVDCSNCFNVFDLVLLAASFWSDIFCSTGLCDRSVNEVLTAADFHVLFPKECILYIHSYQYVTSVCKTKIHNGYYTRPYTTDFNTLRLGLYFFVNTLEYTIPKHKMEKTRHKSINQNMREKPRDFEHLGRPRPLFGRASVDRRCVLGATCALRWEAPRRTRWMAELENSDIWKTQRHQKPWFCLRGFASFGLS